MFNNSLSRLQRFVSSLSSIAKRGELPSRSFIFVVALSCAALTLTSPAQTFTTIATGVGTGYNSPLIQGTDGNLYGTTSGNVFKITPAGTVTYVYGFCSQPGCPDGKSPSGALVQGTDGNFYGTTREGGVTGNNVNPQGTVFKISQKGVFTNIHTFSGSDGGTPNGGLVQGGGGDFFGTTLVRGGDLSLGTTFKISPTGVLTTLYAFPSSGSQGGNPAGGLVQGNDGNFYGVTSDGGGTDCSDVDGSGCGTVFKVTPSGIFTTLAFLEPPDGFPQSSLALGSDGNFYGTANTPEVGAAFQMTPDGAISTLYTFDGSVGFDAPVAGLVQGTDGNFYGTTRVTGGRTCNPQDTDCGTVFQLTPSGELTTLYNFTAGTDGSDPITTLMQATNGIFYGRTSSTIFSLSMGLAPFVIPQPKLGPVGKKITILGTNLTGVSAVSFNGTPATFTAGTSAILATVPAGATTGTITVTTSSGTLLSNVVFTVTD